MNRRKFVELGAVALLTRPLAAQSTQAAGALSPASKTLAPAPTPSGPFLLEPLPYPLTALEPHISAQTLSFHHGKHHAGYVSTLNQRIQGTGFEKQTLEHIILASQDQPKILNMAAQVFNHSFYWNCLSPKPTAPSKKLTKDLGKHFGSVEKFKQAFEDLANGIFGSGWAWLVKDAKGTLSLVATQDAHTPLTQGLTPLLTIDVWEHAYYLDVQNRRKDYIAAVVKTLLNWDFAQQRYDAS